MSAYSCKKTHIQMYGHNFFTRLVSMHIDAALFGSVVVSSCFTLSRLIRSMEMLPLKPVAVDFLCLSVCLSFNGTVVG